MIPNGSGAGEPPALKEAADAMRRVAASIRAASCDDDLEATALQLEQLAFSWEQQAAAALRELHKDGGA